MKSKRLTDIEGWFMGIRFSVKPTPLNIEDIDKKRREMLMDWYKANAPELHSKLEAGVPLDDYTIEDADSINGWKKDVEFRSEYLKFWANACMRFEKPIADDVWSSDEIELSTISEAWDFFTERRMIPYSGVQTR
jgi:hypothetical protein